MKTAAEWLNEIEKEGGLSVYYINAILLDGWRKGMTDAAEIASEWMLQHDHIIPAIRKARDAKKSL